jgi:hypothetical protein
VGAGFEGEVEAEKSVEEPEAERRGGSRQRVEAIKRSPSMHKARPFSRNVQQHRSRNIQDLLHM